MTNYSDGKVIGSSSGKAAEMLGEGRTAIDSDYTPTPLPEPVIGAAGLNLATLEGSANLADGAEDTVAVDLSKVDASTFTRNGLTIHLLGTTDDASGGTGKIQAKTYNELTNDQKTIIAGLFKWWCSECLKLNEESYNLGFNSPTTSLELAAQQYRRLRDSAYAKRQHELLQQSFC